MPVLPIELWIIIMAYKEKLEYRDDCIIGKSPMQLRSGRLIWNNNTRIERFMNDVSYLVSSVNRRSISMVEYLYNNVKNYYYFVNTMKNKTTKTRIQKIINSIENKVEELNISLELFIQESFPKYFTNENRIYCLSLMKECKYFMNHFDCITNTKIACDDHVMITHEGHQFYCSDFYDWCK